MSDDVRIGMIGAGMVGQLAHLANFIEVPGCRVTALAELRPDLGDSAASRFGVPQVFPSHREMLAADVVDAVVVVTRRPATGPIVLDALEAGKHVLSEKPMAHSLAQARRLVEGARARRRVYSVGFMKRHDAGVALARERFDAIRNNGELGKILLLRVWCHCGEFNTTNDGFVMTPEPRPDGIELWPTSPEWIPPEHRDDYAWFLNVFIHDLNLIHHFVGSKPRVVATDFTRRNGRLALFDCGAYPAVLEMSEQKGTDWNEGLEIVFEKGRLAVTLPPPLRKNTSASVTLVRGGTTETLAAEPSWAFQRQAAAFIADIRNHKEPLASGEASLADMELAEDIWRLHLGLGQRS